jgi:hypothetical protein
MVNTSTWEVMSEEEVERGERGARGERGERGEIEGEFEVGNFWRGGKS